MKFLLTISIYFFILHFSIQTLGTGGTECTEAEKTCKEALPECTKECTGATNSSDAAGEAAVSGNTGDAVNSNAGTANSKISNAITFTKLAMATCTKAASATTKTCKEALTKIDEALTKCDDKRDKSCRTKCNESKSSVQTITTECQTTKASFMTKAASDLGGLADSNTSAANQKQATDSNTGSGNSQNSGKSSSGDSTSSTEETPTPTPTATATATTTTTTTTTSSTTSTTTSSTTSTGKACKADSTSVACECEKGSTTNSDCSYFDSSLGKINMQHLCTDRLKELGQQVYESYPNCKSILSTSESDIKNWTSDTLWSSNPQSTSNSSSTTKSSSSAMRSFGISESNSDGKSAVKEGDDSKSTHTNFESSGTTGSSYSQRALYSGHNNPASYTGVVPRGMKNSRNQQMTQEEYERIQIAPSDTEIFKSLSNRYNSERNILPGFIE